MLGRTTTKNQPLSARPMNPVKRPDYCIPWQLAGIREQMPRQTSSGDVGARRFLL